jgi:hypothetical protein
VVLTFGETLSLNFSWCMTQTSPTDVKIIWFSVAVWRVWRKILWSVGEGPEEPSNHIVEIREDISTEAQSYIIPSWKMSLVQCCMSERDQIERVLLLGCLSRSAIPSRAVISTVIPNSLRASIPNAPLPIRPDERPDERHIPRTSLGAPTALRVPNRADIQPKSDQPPVEFTLNSNSNAMWKVCPAKQV